MLTTAEGLAIEAENALKEKIAHLTEIIVSGSLTQDGYKFNSGHVYGLRDAIAIIGEELDILNGKQRGN